MIIYSEVANDCVPALRSVSVSRPKRLPPNEAKDATPAPKPATDGLNTDINASNTTKPKKKKGSHKKMK